MVATDVGGEDELEVGGVLHHLPGHVHGPEGVVMRMSAFARFCSRSPPFLSVVVIGSCPSPSSHWRSPVFPSALPGTGLRFQFPKLHLVSFARVQNYDYLHVLLLFLASPLGGST